MIYLAGLSWPMISPSKTMTQTQSLRDSPDFLSLRTVPAPSSTRTEPHQDINIPCNVALPLANLYSPTAIPSQPIPSDDTRFKSLDPKGCPQPGSKSHPWHRLQTENKLKGNQGVWDATVYSCLAWLNERTLIIIINLIYIAQFNTNSILTALYIVTTYIQMQYVHVWTYLKQSCLYTYTIHTHRHMYKYISTNILTRLPILT